MGNVFISDESPDTLANGDDDVFGIQDMDLGLSSIDVGDAFVRRFVQNFNEQNTIGTDDPFLGQKNFVLKTNGTVADDQIDLNITDDFPYTGPDAWTLPQRQLNTATPIYESWMYEHEPNFDFLPPINKLTPGAKMSRILPFIKTGVDLRKLNAHSAFKMIAKDQDVMSHPFFGSDGMYMQWLLNKPDPMTGLKPQEQDSFMDLFRISAADFYAYEDLGINDYTAARQVFMFPYDRIWKDSPNQEPVKQDPLTIIGRQSSQHSPHGVIIPLETSSENNIIIQIFEVRRDGSIKKLSNIDYGEIRESVSTPYLTGNKAVFDNIRTFFAGKMYQVDPEKDPAMRFCNIFTIMILNFDPSGGAHDVVSIGGGNGD